MFLSEGTPIMNVLIDHVLFLKCWVLLIGGQVPLTNFLHLFIILTL